MIKRIFIFTIIVLNTIIFFYNNSYGAVNVIKFSCLDPDSSIEAQLLRKHFVKYIEEKSNGRYKIDMYTGSSLGNTDTVIQGLNFGTIHLAFDSASNLSQFAPRLAIFDLPYMFTRRELDRAMDSPIGEKLKGEALGSGVHIITFVANFPRNLIARKPFKTVAELEGVKARSTNSKWHIFGLQALGFKPIPMAASEMMTGIQQGVVDCMDIAISAMYGFHVYDVAKYVILTDQTNICTSIFTSAEWWENLSEEDKSLFNEAARQYRMAVNVAVENSTAQFISQLKENGCDVYILPDAERAIWKQKAYEAYEKLPDDMRSLFRELRNAVDAR